VLVIAAGPLAVAPRWDNHLLSRRRDRIDHPFVGVEGFVGDQRWLASSRQRFGSAKWILCRLGSFWAVVGASRREGFSPTEVGPGNGGENSCCRSLRQMVIVKTLWRPCVKT
jgi:hypothetical protein